MKIGQEARDLIREGVNTVNNSVSATMGGCGRLALIEHSQSVLAPHSSKDGLTVLDYSYGNCQYSELGAQMLKVAAKKTVEEEGDGSTTTTVLASAMINKAFDELNLTNHVELINGMKKAKEQTIKHINRLKKEVGDKEMVQIATISANNNAELGEKVAEIYRRVGIDSTIDVKLGNSTETTVEYVEGIKLDRGYSLPYFVNDFSKATCELEDANILIYHGEIKTSDDIAEYIRESLMTKSPMLIICDDIQEAVMTSLVKLKMEGTAQICVIISPEFGEHRTNTLEDLAVSIDASVYNPKYQSVVKLGRAKKIISFKDKTVILPYEETILGRDRIQELKEKLNSADKFETEKLKARIANLNSAIAEITIGGTSEVDIKEKKDLIDDAVGAVRSAIIGGYVAGGGSTLNFIADKLKNNCKGGEHIGFEVFRDSLRIPFEQILKNAGLKAENFKMYKYGKGVDVLKRKEVNLLSKGIIDSAKVITTAVENATSVTCTAISTDVLILTK